MDHKSSSLEHLFMDTGGQILASSFDVKSHEQDVRFIINKVNPLVENVEDRGISFCFGPSGIGLLSGYWRVKEIGKRDRVLNHTLLVPKAIYYSLQANPFRFAELFSDGSNIRNKIEPIQITCKAEPKKNLAHFAGPRANAVLGLYLLTSLGTSTSCIVDTGKTELMEAILTVVPLPSRMMPFATFACQPDPIFRFVVTRPEYQPSFQQAGSKVFQLGTLDVTRVASSFEGQKNYDLARALADLLTDILKTRFHLIDNFDEAFMSLGVSEPSLETICSVVLHTISKTKNTPNTELSNESTIRNLESVMVKESANKAAMVSVLAFRRGGSESLFNLIKQIETIDRSKLRDVVNASLNQLVNAEMIEDVKQVLNYLVQAGYQIPDSEALLMRLLDLKVAKENVRLLGQVIRMILETSPALGPSSVNLLMSWFDKIYVPELSGVEGDILLQIAFDKVPNVRYRLFATSFNKFVNLLLASTRPQDSVGEIVDNTNVNIRDKIRLLKAVIEDPHVSFSKEHLLNMLGDQLKSLKGTNELLRQETYEGVRLLSTVLRANVISEWVINWKDYSGQPSELQYLTLLKEILNPQIYQPTDSRVSEEITKYASTILNQAATHFSSEGNKKAKQVIGVLSILSEENRSQAWDSKSYRKTLQLWIEKYMDQVHVTGATTDEIIQSMSDVVKNEILGLHALLQAIIKEEQMDSVRKRLASTIERIIREASDELIKSVTRTE